MKGILQGITALGRRTLVTLILDAKAEDLERYYGKEIDAEIGPLNAKKSLSQNAYYWALLTKVAAHKDIRASTARQHNLMLRQHARFLTIGGLIPTVLLKDDDETEDKVLEDAELHLYPTSATIENSKGTRFRYYRIMRGVRTYNVEEMSVLLDDLIEGAQALGIETLTTDELERIRIYEREREARKSEQGEGRAV